MSEIHKRTFLLDGTEHYAPGNLCDCNSNDNICPKCLHYMHYQACFGGYIAHCEHCDKESEIIVSKESKDDKDNKGNKKWYIGAMNDALFIINFTPRPAPVDYLVPLNTDLRNGDLFIAGPFTPDKKGMETITMIVEEHNRLLGL